MSFFGAPSPLPPRPRPRPHAIFWHETKVTERMIWLDPVSPGKYSMAVARELKLP